MARSSLRRGSIRTGRQTKLPHERSAILSTRNPELRFRKRSPFAQSAQAPVVRGRRDRDTAFVERPARGVGRIGAAAHDPRSYSRRAMLISRVNTRGSEAPGRSCDERPLTAMLSRWSRAHATDRIESTSPLQRYGALSGLGPKRTLDHTVFFVQFVRMVSEQKLEILPDHSPPPFAR